MSVQWTVSDPKAYLLEVRSPEISLDHAAESALRHAIGSAELHQVLTEGRAEISVEIQARTQNYLDAYQTGIMITTVNIEDAQPPQQVQAAFDDVIRAKEDEQRVKNQAETYRNGLIPEARGLAARQREEASGYKQQVIAQADGEAKRFSQLLAEYEKAPKVTRQRLYIDTMQRVMESTSKVMVDIDSGSLMYLPLDKLMSGAKESPITAENNHSSFYSEDPRSSTQDRNSRSSNRREGR